jgi:polysaccharide export outer membrane protein
MLNAAMSATGENTYLIGTEDVLDIESYNVEELKKTVRVNSRGEIALPLVGIINVKGLATSEAEQLIAGRLDKYVQETAVTVFVREYKSQRIAVVGAVKKPQVFAVTGQRYLIDMLMAAEGIAPEAGSICYVIRPGVRTGSGSDRTSTTIIDLDELLINGNVSLNIPVYSGDVINVPRGGIFFVDGSVRIPGPYAMKGKTTLVQAISMAQGLKDDAAAGGVRIFRENGKGERVSIEADYTGMIRGTVPDMLVADNDIIIVPPNEIKNFFNGFINILKGWVSFGAMAL